LNVAWTEADFAEKTARRRVAAGAVRPLFGVVERQPEPLRSFNDYFGTCGESGRQLALDACQIRLKLRNVCSKAHVFSAQNAPIDCRSHAHSCRTEAISEQEFAFALRIKGLKYCGVPVHSYARWAQTAHGDLVEKERRLNHRPGRKQ
jgi:hypothetical protein